MPFRCGRKGDAHTMYYGDPREIDGSVSQRVNLDVMGVNGDAVSR